MDFLLNKSIEIEEENFNIKSKLKAIKLIMKFLGLMILHKIEKGQFFNLIRI